MAAAAGDAAAAEGDEGTELQEGGQRSGRGALHTETETERQREPPSGICKP